MLMEIGDRIVLKAKNGKITIVLDEKNDAHILTEGNIKIN